MLFSFVCTVLTVGSPLIMQAERNNKKGNLLGTIPKLSPSYSVTFEFKPTHPQLQTSYTNIIHLTIGGDFAQYGDRIPGVWVENTSSDAAKIDLIIASAVNGDENYFLRSRNMVTIEEWSTFEITQLREDDLHRYTVKVNGVVLKSMINTQTKEFMNVKVYGADPWYEAVPGSIRNLVIEPFVKGNYIFAVASESLNS